MSETKSGKLLTCTGGLYTAEIEGELWECYAKGGFRHESVTPVPGDIAAVRTETIGNKQVSYIIDIEERKNILLRPPVANLDRIFIVSAVCQPDPSLLNLDKICSVAIHNGIEVVVIFSKTDLDPGKANELREIYEKAGFQVLCLSMEDQEQVRSSLLGLVSGVSAAFTGASGVGKSTLMNILFPDLKLVTGEISRKITRGKNTTRQSVFYNISRYTGVPASYLADTPGFSQLDFTKFRFLEKEELVYSFPEFADHIGKCRYTKCTHRKEEECRIVEAVEKGEISPSRHESYCRLYEDLQQFKKWKK